MSVVVYRYGTPHWATLPPDVDASLRDVHNVREELVSLEHQRQDRITAVWSSHPEIAALEERIERAEQDAAEVARQAAAERSAQRKRGRTASTPRLQELRAAIRQDKQRRRELIADVRNQEGDRLQAIEDEHRTAIKDLYRKYCQDGQLYWASYNDVLDHHKTAVKRVKQARAAGKPATLRHHRWDGSGTLAVQLQRQAGMPPRSPALLASGEGPWRNVLRLEPWVEPDDWAALSRAEQRRRRLGTARLCLGHGRHVEIPVVVHRMLPADADVTGARLVVRRIGGHRRIEVHVTANIPDPEPSTSPLAAALHLGWRRDEDTIRVGTWRTTQPVTVPPHLRDVVVADTDRTGRIVLPVRLTRRTTAHDELRAQRDTALDRVRQQLVDWLSRHGPVAIGNREVGAADVKRWRNPGRFARLAILWRDAPPPHGADIAATLEAWRVTDRRLWEPEAHGRDGVVAARNDAYRRAAAWLTSLAGTVVVDDTVIAELARTPDPTRAPELPSAVERGASRQRTLASPGRLRELITMAASARGVEVVTVPHTGVTRTHHRCGHLNPADDRYARSRFVACDGCGATYDQDGSATLNMLAASGHVPPASQGTARDTV